MSKTGKPVPERGDVICTHALLKRAQRNGERFVVEKISRSSLDGQSPHPGSSCVVTVRRLGSGSAYDPHGEVVNIDLQGIEDDGLADEFDPVFVPRNKMGIVGSMRLESPYTFTPVRPSRSE